MLRLTAAGVTFALVAVVAGTAVASTNSPSRHGDDGGGGGGGSTIAPAKITVVNQIADTSGVANVTDPDLLNPWGLSIGPSGGALWVSNNNSNTTTLYNGAVNGAAATKNSLTVAIPGGKPTGTVFSGGSD